MNPRFVPGSTLPPHTVAYRARTVTRPRFNFGRLEAQNPRSARAIV